MVWRARYTPIMDGTDAHIWWTSLEWLSVSHTNEEKSAPILESSNAQHICYGLESEVRPMRRGQGSRGGKTFWSCAYAATYSKHHMSGERSVLSLAIGHNRVCRKKKSRSYSYSGKLASVCTYTVRPLQCERTTFWVICLPMTPPAD